MNWWHLWASVVRNLFGQLRAFRQSLLHRRGRLLVISPPMLWMGLFFAIPFAIVLRISFAEADIGQPPYTALLAWVDDSVLSLRLNLGNYRLLIDDDLYLAAYLGSLRIAAISTLLCLLIGYPMAYGIARAPERWRLTLILLIILPFWTSFLIRIYAWMGLLRGNGLINQILLGLGIIDQPLQLLHTDFAVYIGIVYSYLPFMVLPLVATLIRMDLTLLQAAADLGCPPWKAFLRITLPLSMPGVIAGSLLVFVPAVGEFVIPDLLGGPDTLMIGKVLWSEFFSNRDWPVASSIAIAMLMLIVMPILLFEYIRGRNLQPRSSSQRELA